LLQKKKKKKKPPPTPAIWGENQTGGENNNLEQKNWGFVPVRSKGVCPVTKRVHSSQKPPKGFGGGKKKNKHV